MTALFLSAFVAIVSANVSLVVFVADRLSPETASSTDAPVFTGYTNAATVA